MCSLRCLVGRYTHIYHRITPGRVVHHNSIDERFFTTRDDTTTTTLLFFTLVCKSVSKTRVIHGSKHHPLERDDVVVVFRPPANANAGRVRERSVREETRAAAAAAAAAARETPRGRGMHRYRCRFPFDTQNALRSFVRVSVTVFFSSQMLSLVSRTLHPPRLNHRRYTDGRKTRDCTF